MTKEIKIKASLEKEGVLKEILSNSKQNEELIKVMKVLDVLNDDYCKDNCISSLEARVFGISRASLLSGVLSRYKEYILNNKE